MNELVSFLVHENDLSLKDLEEIKISLSHEYLFATIICLGKLSLLYYSLLRRTTFCTQSLVLTIYAALLV